MGFQILDNFSQIIGLTFAHISISYLGIDSFSKAFVDISLIIALLYLGFVDQR